MNLNDIFQVKSDKLEAFLEAFIVDKAGNIFIDPDQVAFLSSYDKKILADIDDLEASISDIGDGALSALSSYIDPKEIGELISFFTDEEDRLNGIREQEISFENLSSTWMDGDPPYVMEEGYQPNPGETPSDILDSEPIPEDEDDDSENESQPSLSEPMGSRSDLSPRKPISVEDIDNIAFDAAWDIIDNYKSLAKKAIRTSYDCAKKGLSLGNQSKKVIDNFTEKYEDFMAYDPGEPLPPRLPEGYDVGRYRCCKKFSDAAIAHKKYCLEVEGLESYFDKIENDESYAKMTSACKAAYVAGLYYGLVDWKLGRLEYAAKRIVLWFTKVVALASVTFTKTIRAFGSLFSDDWSKEGIKQNLKNMLLADKTSEAYLQYKAVVDTATAIGMDKKALKEAIATSIVLLLSPVAEDLIDVGLAELLESYTPDKDKCIDLVSIMKNYEDSYKNAIKRHHVWCHGPRAHKVVKTTELYGTYAFYEDNNMDHTYAPEASYSETVQSECLYDENDEVLEEDKTIVDSTDVPVFPEAYDSLIDPESGVSIPVKSAKWVCEQDGQEYSPGAYIPTTYVAERGDSIPSAWNFYLDVELDLGNA